MQHIYNKSIAGYTIFREESDYARFFAIVKYFQKPHRGKKITTWLNENADSIAAYPEEGEGYLGDIICFCLMPTHFHLVMSFADPSFIPKFMSDVLNSYTRYFNTKYGRKGPLWEGRFKKREIESDEDLINLTRYIHLNPVTAYLCEKPLEWAASSYAQYIGEAGLQMCRFEHIIEMQPSEYCDFVENYIDNQRELALAK